MYHVAYGYCASSTNIVGVCSSASVQSINNKTVCTRHHRHLMSKKQDHVKMQVWEEDDQINPQRGRTQGFPQNGTTSRCWQAILVPAVMQMPAAHNIETANWSSLTNTVVEAAWRQQGCCACHVNITIDLTSRCPAHTQMQFPGSVRWFPSSCLVRQSTRHWHEIELSAIQAFLPFSHNPAPEYSFCSILFLHPLSSLQYQQPYVQTVWCSDVALKQY